MLGLTNCNYVGVFMGDIKRKHILGENIVFLSNLLFWDAFISMEKYRDLFVDEDVHHKKKGTQNFINSFD